MPGRASATVMRLGPSAARRLRRGSEFRAAITGLYRGLARCRRGATMVEFAMLAAPFFALMFLILNTALTFVAQQTLQTATTEAARLVMTGQAQTQGMTASQFQQAVCTNAGTMFSCSGLYVSVQTFSSFSSLNTTQASATPIQNGTLNTTNLPFSMGNKGDIELIQVFYQWPLFATGLGYNYANLSSGSDLLIASAAFRNEPF